MTTVREAVALGRLGVLLAADHLEEPETDERRAASRTIPPRTAMRIAVLGVGAGAQRLPSSPARRPVRRCGRARRRDTAYGLDDARAEQPR